MRQCGSKTLGDANGVARIGDVVEQHRELVSAEPRQRESAAVPRDDVGSAQARLKPPRDRNEQAIGAEHAQALIHHLESIETEDEQREDVVGMALGALDGAVEQIDEEQPVRQPGERVGHLASR